MDQDNNKWIIFGRQNINLLNKILKKLNLTPGEKSKVLTTIFSLASTIENMKCLQRRGESIAVRSKRADRICWVDVDSALQGRIRTGIIVNLLHKDLKSSLNDTKTLSTMRLTSTLKRMWIGIPILLPHRFHKVLSLREYIAWFWLPHRGSFVDTSNFYNLMSR